MNLYPHGYSEDDLDEARAAGRREVVKGLAIWLKHKEGCYKTIDQTSELVCNCGLAAKIKKISCDY